MDKPERNALIARLGVIRGLMYGPREAPLPTEELRALNREAEQTKATYYAGLPAVAVSRCPFCAAIRLMAMDMFGLDGPWWDALGTDGPGNVACRHHLVTLGALDMAAEVAAEATGEVQPGPAVPYVVPRLMRLPGMTCVLYATAKIPEGAGATLYLMSYFSDPPTPGAEGHQPWLRRQYWYRDADGNVMWNTRNDAWDFELAPWMEGQAPKLLWIEADDPEMVLRRGPADRCPYLGLTGRRHPIAIRAGRIFTLPMPDGDTVDSGDLFD